jgi:hypothetical protein
MDVHHEFSRGDASVIHSLGLLQLQDRLSNYDACIWLGCECNLTRGNVAQFRNFHEKTREGGSVCLSNAHGVADLKKCNIS